LETVIGSWSMGAMSTRESDVKRVRVRKQQIK